MFGMSQGDKPKQIVLEGAVLIDYDRIAHITDKFEEHRECFANRIEPTLVEPNEIWCRWHPCSDDPEGELRAYYIKFFGNNPHGIAIASVCRHTGKQVLLNFIPVSRAEVIAKQRRGMLLYSSDRPWEKEKKH